MTNLHVQDYYAEGDSDCASTLADGHKVHYEHTCPEARLEAVHCQECSWFERIAEEEENGEDVDEQDDDNEEHEHDHGSGGNQYCIAKSQEFTYPTAGCMTSLKLSMLRSVHEYAAMMKIIIHMRAIQKGTKMRFFQRAGCCDMLVF